MKNVFLKQVIFCLIFSFITIPYVKAQWTTSGSNIYNSNTGNVGVGFTSPGSKLDVQTSTANDGMHIRYNSTGFLHIAANAMGSGAYNGLTVAGDAGIYFGATSPTNLTFGFVICPWMNGFTGLRVDNNGNVGIATSNTQGYQLAVNGSAIFTKAVVKLYANWPDYVFEKSYHLPSLKNIEEYIKANNHLPETPSATEVEKNGIDLGQSQALLLKKIEELTLYVIELDKKVQQLSKENEELKKSLKQ